MADFRSVLNARLRMSTTAAIRDTAPLDRRARSTMVGSRPGGRLSTTNQPRSSSDLAAAVRPAPDIPVIITMSVWSSAILLLPVCLQGRDDSRGQFRADPRHGANLLGPRRAQLAHRTELLEQRLPPGRAEARHVIERALDGCLAALLPLVVNSEPVCLVPHPLQQVQSLT